MLERVRSDSNFWSDTSYQLLAQVLPSIIDAEVPKVLNQSPGVIGLLLAAGPRIFTTTGPTRIPKVDPPMRVELEGQIALSDRPDPKFNQVLLMPKLLRSTYFAATHPLALVRRSIDRSRPSRTSSCEHLSTHGTDPLHRRGGCRAPADPPHDALASEEQRQPLDGDDPGPIVHTTR